MQSVATRGWELPNLQEVQAKSDALAASGFATVHSPVISKASQHALAKQASQSNLECTDYRTLCGGPLQAVSLLHIQSVQQTD